MSAYGQRSGSLLRVTGVCLGAIVLLYGGSLYSRDWRLAVNQAGQPVNVQPLRPTTARPVAMEAVPAGLPAQGAVRTSHVKPEVTRAVSPGPDPQASAPTAATAPSQSEQAGPPSNAPSRVAAAPSRVAAQAEAWRKTANPARSRTQQATRRPPVQYSRLRAQPAAPQQAAWTQGSGTAAASREATFPLTQLIQFFAPGGVH